jgi:hypothetical protein
MSAPRSAAISAVKSTQERAPASTTTTTLASAAMMRWLAMKHQGWGGKNPGGSSATAAPRPRIRRCS